MTEPAVPTVQLVFDDQILVFRSIGGASAADIAAEVSAHNSDDTAHGPTSAVVISDFPILLNVDQSTTYLVQSTQGVLFVCPNSGGSSHLLHGIFKTFSQLVERTFSCKFSLLAGPGVRFSGLAVMDSIGGSTTAVGIYRSAASAVPVIARATFDTQTTTPPTPLIQPIALGRETDLHVRIFSDVGNSLLHFYTSWDGNIWTLLSSLAFAAFDQIGFIQSVASATQGGTVLLQGWIES